MNNSFHIIGAARNIAPFIEPLMRNLLTIKASYPNTTCLIIESDSGDNTYEILKKWTKVLPWLQVQSLGRLRKKYPLRTDRLAYVRNKAYQEGVKSKSEYLVWMDLDDVTAEPISMNIFKSIFDLPEDWGFVTATKDNEYYDIWALRHEEICPYDCIKEIKLAGWENRAAHEKFRGEPAKKIINHLKNNRLLKVGSAFGGLAVQKNDVYLGEKPFNGLYEDGDEVCEWVSFCEKIRGTGRSIYIDNQLRIG